MVFQRAIRIYIDVSRIAMVLMSAAGSGIACTMLLFLRARELYGLRLRCLTRDYWISIIAMVMFLLPVLLIDASGLTDSQRSA